MHPSALVGQYGTFSMPTEIEIHITPLFSTPLLVFAPADQQRINARLSPLILEREASMPTHRDTEVVDSRPVHVRMGQRTVA